MLDLKLGLSYKLVAWQIYSIMVKPGSDVSISDSKHSLIFYDFFSLEKNPPLPPKISKYLKNKSAFLQIFINRLMHTSLPAFSPYLWIKEKRFGLSIAKFLI